MKLAKGAMAWPSRELVQGGDLKLVVPLGTLGKGAGVVAFGELN
jgi:hypothetical protein